MKITILSVGSRGDVQPYIALGLGLQKAGHTVTIATNENFESFVTQYGLRYEPLEGDAEALIAGEIGLSATESGRNFYRLARDFRKTLDLVLEPFLAGVERVCKDADAVVYGVLGFFGGEIAPLLGIPAVPAYLQPLTRSSEVPSMIATRDLGKVGNRTSHIVSEQLYWQTFRPQVNKWRKETLGLHPYPLQGPFSAFHREQRPILYGYSQTIFPSPRDWHDNVYVSGYWFLEKPQAWEPPRELLAFLESDPPPIYIGFGSMRVRDPVQFTQTVVSALSKTDERAILLTGWGGLASELDLPDTVFALPSAPHDWLFPRVKAVIHHGGTGTTAAGLRAGKPTLVLPFLGDQFFWGKRVHAIGAGVKPLAQKAVTADELATAITELTQSTLIKLYAERIGRTLRTENGVENAVTWLERQLTIN